MSEKCELCGRGNLKTNCSTCGAPMCCEYCCLEGLVDYYKYQTEKQQVELEALREVEKRARMFDYKDRIDDLNTPFHKLYNDLRNALNAVEKVRGHET